ncbi:RusA family crossover junction endodeoxyribonuclease [Candidatus Avelusimicrobium gallicola]|uniref:Uncharacterized protein n=1 Tax=Candidatus Avelusimicrobium gallicola TaxID=2562704 RepID=A0A1Y4DIA1_9BACT|nr:RusA family crossover junction endodeoxyribonuclease [Elusimicrobium sp. An273]OUO56668.1 hypothetical protein B5F75_05610 [Elusimicrobium sp. An273]
MTFPINDGIYRLWVPFRPQAQQRHRFNFKARRAYQPEPEFKACVVAEAVKKRPPRPLEGAVGAKLTYCYRRPACRMYEIYKTTKPDLDNLEKPVFDALKRAGWIKDDANIVHTEIKKIWADFDGLKLELSQLKNVRDFGYGK